MTILSERTFVFDNVDANKHLLLSVAIYTIRFNSKMHIKIITDPRTHKHKVKALLNKRTYGNNLLWHLLISIHGKLVVCCCEHFCSM
jgi:hypothetical protein